MVNKLFPCKVLTSMEWKQVSNNSFQTKFEPKMCVQNTFGFTVPFLVMSILIHQRVLKKEILAQGVLTKVGFDHFSLRKSYLCTLCRSIVLFGKWQHKNIDYEDSDIVEPPDDRPESLPLYAPWFSPSPPREDGEEEEAGDDEEVLWERMMAPAALQWGRGPGSGV